MEIFYQNEESDIIPVTINYCIYLRTALWFKAKISLYF